MYRIVIYQKLNGHEPFIDQLEDLDRVTQTRIRKRISRIELGLLGDHKHIDQDLIELRLLFGSGYRVYCGIHQQQVVLLLCGGDKSTQTKDVQKAKTY